MTTAAFKACYAEWKVIKTRATVQLVFEIPIEQADAAYQALGGMPVAAREVWCGIARLNEVPAPSVRAVSSSGEREPVSDPGFSAERGRKSPAQIAGYLCTLPSFHRFLREKFSACWHDNIRGDLTGEQIAAECVRDICTVESRSQITDDNAEWSALRLAFMLWEKEAEVVPA